MSSSSSSSSDKGDPSGAAAERVKSEYIEIAAAEIVSGAEDVTAVASSADESTASSTSSEDEDVVVRTSTEEDEVSMDEPEAAEVSYDSTPVASTSKPISAEGAIEEHVTVGVITSVERVVETTLVTITSSGETVQGGPSRSDSYVDPSLFDSSPSTRHYVRRARRGSIVSIDSEKTVSATVRIPTPQSPLHESGGTAPTPITIAVEVFAAAAVQESGIIPTAIEEIPVGEKVPAHIPDIPEGNNFIESIPINENFVIDTDFGTVVTQVEHAEVAASEDPAQADIIPDSDVPVIEEELAQGPVDDIDMVDVHDSYDEVLVETEDHVAGVEAADMEVTAPVTAYASPTEIGIWPFYQYLAIALA